MKSEETINYNFLIIGRSGSGKSATTKFLTGNPSILVANSIKQVTTQVKFYEGITIPLTTPLNGFKKARFGVIDLPGLDKIDNRFYVRENLLEQLVAKNISINGVIYVASLTQRDTIDPKKMFKFIQQLPWYQDQIKHCLIPVLTKYDNLVIDSPDQEISSVLKEFQQIFHQAGYSHAWSKRIYWINHTKSLDFKMKIRQEIKEVYEKQLQRLLSVTKKNKILLTVDTIQQFLEQQQSYVAENLLIKIANNQVPCSKSYVEHKVGLKIIVRPAKFFESVTTFSASSIGIILSQLCKKQIPSALSLILTGIPMIIAFLNLIKSSNKMAENRAPQIRNFKNHNQQKIEKICKKIKNCITQQWKKFVQSLQFFINTKFLYARLNLSSLPLKNFVFLEPQTFLQLKIGQKQFQRVFMASEGFDAIPKMFGHNDLSQVINQKDLYLYRIEIPEYDQQHVWMPQVEVICAIKIFDEKILLSFVQNQRITFLQDGKSQSKINVQIESEQKHQQQATLMEPIIQ